VFTATRKRGHGRNARAFLEIFSPSLLAYQRCVTSLMATGMQGGYYAVTILGCRTYLKTVRGLSVIGNRRIPRGESFSGAFGRFT